jgi:hypothetical protein
MRKLGTLLALGLMTALVACGGGDGSDTDAGTPLAGNGGGGFGGVGGFGGGGAGGGAGAGSCNYPSCLATITNNCSPSGTCVKQTNNTTGAINFCYSNGVKEIAAPQISGASISYVVTVKNGTATCYSMTMDPSAILSGGAAVMTLKNPSGATVGTMSLDTATGQATVTCTGAAPVVLAADCTDGFDPTGTSAGSTACPEGTCAP